MAVARKMIGYFDQGNDVQDISSKEGFDNSN